MQIALEVSRYNPPADSAAHFQTFTLDDDELHGGTVLDALHYIKDVQDGTLSFRRACRAGICGSCAMVIDGRGALACNTQLRPLATRGRVRVEPLNNYTPIKDLVVDMGPFWQQMKDKQAFLKSGTEEEDLSAENRVSPEHSALLSHSASCIFCGACQSACNVLTVDKGFYGPAVFNQIYRFSADTRDKAYRERLEQANAAGGVWDCTHCYYCTEVCPKGVDPRERIANLAEQIVDEGLTDDPGARHARSFVHSIKTWGRLSEASLTKDTLGVRKLATDYTWQGLKMALKGKAPDPIMHPIREIDEVQRLLSGSGKNPAGTDPLKGSGRDPMPNPHSKPPE